MSEKSASSWRSSNVLIKSVMVDPSGKIVSPSPSPKLPLDIPNKPATGVVKVSLPAPKQRQQKDTSPNGHWQFDDLLGQNKEFGFIYLIHDTINDKMYIGKKQFFGTGAQNKGVESDWKRYTSSCKALQAVIKEHGKEHFNFYVLDQYKIRGTLGYAETWSLMYCETPANKDKWYNSLVNKISWTVKEGVSEKHRLRLRALVTRQPHLLSPYVSDKLSNAISGHK